MKLTTAMLIGALVGIFIIWGFGAFVTWDLQWYEGMAEWSNLHRAIRGIFMTCIVILSTFVGWGIAFVARET